MTAAATSTVITGHHVTRCADDAQERILVSRLTAKTIEVYGHSSSSPKATEVATKIRRCSEPENIRAAFDLLNYASGELYAAPFVAAPCHSRYCAWCARVRYNRSRRRVWKTVKAYERAEHRNWQWMSLTIPKPSHVSLLLLIECVLESWANLIETKSWKEKVRGGFRGIHWTVDRNESYHIHLHCLIDGEMLDGSILSLQWNKRAELVFGKRGIPLQFTTDHDSVTVGPMVPKPGETLEIALEKYCAYIGEIEQWDDLSVEHLGEFVELKRLPRLIGSFGALWKRSRPILDRHDLKSERDTPANFQANELDTTSKGKSQARQISNNHEARIARRRAASVAMRLKGQPHAVVLPLTDILKQRLGTLLAHEDQYFGVDEVAPSSVSTPKAARPISPALLPRSRRMVRRFFPILAAPGRSSRYQLNERPSYPSVTYARVRGPTAHSRTIIPMRDQSVRDHGLHNFSTKTTE